MIRSEGVGVESGGWGSLFSRDGFTKSAMQKSRYIKEANLCFLLCVLPFLDVVWCGSVVVVVSGTSVVLPGSRTRN